MPKWYTLSCGHEKQSRVDEPKEGGTMNARLSFSPHTRARPAVTTLTGMERHIQEMRSAAKIVE